MRYTVPIKQGDIKITFCLIRLLVLHVDIMLPNAFFPHVEVHAMFLCTVFPVKHVDEVFRL